MLLAGREQLDGDEDGDGGSSCGRETEAVDVRAMAEARWNTGAATTAVEQLELAVRDGSYRAAFMLATLMLSGIGGTAAHGLPAPGTVILRIGSFSSIRRNSTSSTTAESCHRTRRYTIRLGPTFCD